MAGGRTNATWRGQGVNGDVVVKLYSGARRNPLFPNEPDAEVKVLEALAPLGFAPRSVFAFRSGIGRCVAYRYLPGDMWRHDTRKVGRLLRRLHGIAPPGGLRRCPDGSAALLDHAKRILSRCRQHGDLARLRPSLDVSPSGKTAFLHGDVVPGNLIVSESALCLIDWQCPGIGDPCEDIAVFLSPAMQKVYRGAPLSAAEIERFFEGYDCATIRARYVALAPAYHWRMAAYCQWQTENGQPDYVEALREERAALESSRAA